MTATNMNDEITKLKGIGPKKANNLGNLGIGTIEDLVYFYPRQYEDRRVIKKIDQLCHGEKALIRGEIQLVIKGKQYSKNKQTLKLLVKDTTETIEIIFFNATYLEKSLQKNVLYDFFGTVNIEFGKIQMVHPELNRTIAGNKLGILPIYPLTKGIWQSDMRKWQETAKPYAAEIQEYLPKITVERNNLCTINYALQNIHFPADGRKLKEAKYRLIFDELFLLQVGLLSLRARNEAQLCGTAFSKDVDMHVFLKTFPYELTRAQKRVLQEINEDMESEKVMHRLVQGDVGSGKTAVAAAAIYKTVKSGYQAVLMAPTEILARQHYDGLKVQFDAMAIRVGFLSGSLKTKEKKEVVRQLENGEIDLIIGTHAIIQPTVSFAKLGLVITDEQHRFGVNQRAELRKKGENPDILVMTATPIPRTLAVVLYGDLDISVIDEMPPGRQAILTKRGNEKNRESIYAFLKKEVEQGRQAYIVAPLIEDSQEVEARSATALQEEVQNKFRDFSVKLLHGGMKQSEKDQIMKDFYLGTIEILVSTVVIEVGINVPNATVMIIENAERFGLAQLHQLRGRVGRGEAQSYCILISDEKSPISKKRNQTMVDTNDGFIIAEKDLELRGPGEFFGTKQHGLPELKIADLVKHSKILNIARKEVDFILLEDSFLEKKDNQLLKAKLDCFFHPKLTNL